ncbi:MAG: Gfo/Idh/MocA family oxidoreductase [Planctomycetes bacterium]|nr:Gfo/Idh/MocA family oxidoreductase [Planctomycetota bacterium]
MKTGAVLSAGGLVSSGGRAFAAGSDRIRVAMIGCGNRGTKDALDCLNSDPGIEMVALAEVLPDRLEEALARLKKAVPDRVKVTPETSFIGFDAYRKVLAMKEVDAVLLLTPPGFRPVTLRAAVEAGKHVFLEKPGAGDPVGVRSLLASADLADQKKLSLVVGTQQRWQPQYQELMKRVHDGALGEVVGGQAYWNWGSSKWHWEPRQAGWSDMEWQIRCWPYFVWLSGDHIVEQHLHNMDVINWAIGAHPVSCLGMGGRQSRTGPEFGNIWDHFTVEYEYPNGVRVMSMCSQIEGSTQRVGERVLCAKGATVTDRSMGYIEDTRGRKVFTYNDPIHSGEVAQFRNLFQSIRNGQPLNECRRIAETTMTLIMGRMSAYTGRAMKWDWALNASKLDLTPPKLEMGDLPVPPPAIPGQTQLL